MIETILLALLFSKLRGYKLKPLFKSWTIYPVLLFAMLYIAFEIMIFNRDYSLLKYSSSFHLLYILSFLSLILKYKLNISAIIGSLCILVGTILNNIAIRANNGSMPVFPSISYKTGYFREEALGIANDIHILGNPSTKMKFLTDYIDIGYCIMSIGDIFIRVFAFVIIFNAVKYLNKNNINTKF